MYKSSQSLWLPAKQKKKKKKEKIWGQQILQISVLSRYKIELIKYPISKVAATFSIIYYFAFSKICNSYSRLKSSLDMYKSTCV